MLPEGLVELFIEIIIKAENRDNKQQKAQGAMEGVMKGIGLELGYVEFALDMYGEGKITAHPEQASEWAKQISSNIESRQRRAAAGLKVLPENPGVDPNRIAATGWPIGVPGSI